MKLAIGRTAINLSIVALAGAPLESSAAERFGAQGTLLPKGSVSIIHQVFEGNANGRPIAFTSIAIAPELGYFLIDDLVLFGSVQLGAFFFAGGQSFSVGGGLGLGYHIAFADGVGLLPEVDVSLGHTKSRDFASTGLVARGRVPLVFSRQNFFFGIGPEGRWYTHVDGDPGVGGSFLVGLFTEIGGWL